MDVIVDILKLIPSLGLPTILLFILGYACYKKDQQIQDLNNEIKQQIKNYEDLLNKTNIVLDSILKLWGK